MWAKLKKKKEIYVDLGWRIENNILLKHLYLFKKYTQAKFVPTK